MPRKLYHRPHQKKPFEDGTIRAFTACADGFLQLQAPEKPLGSAKQFGVFAGCGEGRLL